MKIAGWLWVGLPLVACAETEPEVPANRRFAISQLLVTPEGFQAFAAFADTLDPTGSIDAGDSVPLPAGSRFVRGPVAGSFIVTSGEAPEAIRFDVDADGTVTETGRIAFAGVGLSGVPPNIVVVSETKAYYLSEASGLGFVFDPTAMVITDEIDLGLLASPDPANLEGVLGVSPAQDGDVLLFPMLYRDLDQGTAATLARVVVLDTVTDAVSVIDDERCSYLTNVAVADNGDVYVSSDAFNGAVRGALPDATGPSCILRIRAGQRVFDPSFYVETEALTGTPVSGGLVAAGGDEVYVLGYDETVSPLGASFPEINGTPAWRTYRTRLGDTMPPGEVVDGIPLRSSGVGVPIEAEGALYDAVAAADFSSTALYRLDDPSAPTDALVLPGFQFGVIDLQAAP
ncbi:MAG: DUF4374 domain-containing protein [Myxococcota bacterium]